MDYAIIDLKGHQYQVKPGEELTVDRIDLDKNKKFDIDKVLLVKQGKKITIGQPTVDKTVVKAKVLDHFKGDKIRVAKFRAKTRYRKVKGFRPYMTKIKIEDIKAK